jgi:prepilin-type N-terminal cleavage/methylation domain-containing protein
MKVHLYKTGRHSGMSLLEVLVAIVIFAIGIMALSQLLGGLSRSAGDANTRTVAINIAEDVIERHRGFSRISVDPDGIEYAYEDISPAQYGVTQGSLDYNVDIGVQEYWFDRNSRQFTGTEPLVAAYSDFKIMTVNVDWGDGPEFIVDESNTTTGRLGSGGVVLTEIISSITSAADAKSATGGTGDLYHPSINYNPGSNPEIISISLGQNKFKESTTPLPKVIRTDELAETTFDVVTYSQNEAGAVFLRREEFRSISCNCSLRVPGADTQGGLRPTLWNGTGYTVSEFVSKPYAVSASNVQSKFCASCCRDHHDGGTGDEDDDADPGRARFNPFRDAGDYWDSGALAGDHKHYYRNSDGGLSLATANGSEYMEACRMVRRDGFWQIAQDLRQEGLNVFPENFLDSAPEVAVYSDYITAAVSEYTDVVAASSQYESTPHQLTVPSAMVPAVEFPAATPESATHLPTALGRTTQQLRSRGIYIDYMSNELREVISCIEQGGSGEICGAPNKTTPLEVIPFYDVQLTWLSRWNESPFNNPVDTSNEAIADNNVHSRGLATLTSGTGPATVIAEVHKGNLGLTGTDPVDNNYTADLARQDLYVQASSYATPPGLNEYLITGLITSSIKGFKASDVEISSSGAQCNRTNTGYKCLLETGANNSRLTVTNYYKSNNVRLACSQVLELQGSLTGANGWTRFDLPASESNNADIVIKQNGC